MIIGERLTEIRVQKKMSQGEVEKRTGLLRCYISRVENGHTVPSVETLEKLARAYEIPFYQIFYDGEVPADFKRVVARTDKKNGTKENIPEMKELRKYLSKLKRRDQMVLLAMANILSRWTKGSSGVYGRSRAENERNARTGQDRRLKVAVG